MFELKDYVELGDKQYLVSTVDTFDRGLETMVFESVNKEVIDYKELCCRHYKDKKEALKGHADVIKVIKLLDKVLKKYY